MKANDNQSLFEVFKPGVLDGYTFWQKLVYWFKNVYWYHFKKQTIWGIVALVLIAMFISDVFFKVQGDLKYIICADVSLSYEQQDGVNAYIKEFVPDFNGDEKIVSEYQVLETVDAEKGDQMAIAAEDKLALSFAEDDILLYILDGKHMETYATQGAFEKLEYFGIESDATYCLEITDCKLFKELGIPTPTDGWYIGAKVLSDTYRAEDEEILKKYEAISEILLDFAEQ